MGKTSSHTSCLVSRPDLLLRSLLLLVPAALAAGGAAKHGSAQSAVREPKQDAWFEASRFTVLESLPSCGKACLFNANPRLRRSPSFAARFVCGHCRRCPLHPTGPGPVCSLQTRYGGLSESLLGQSLWPGENSVFRLKSAVYGVSLQRCFNRFACARR